MRSKDIQKYKSKTVPALIKIATRHFNEYIRLRDSRPVGADPDERWGKCISCGNHLTVPSVNAQAGHFYSGGHYPILRFNDKNVNLQCKSCNYFKSGNLIEYRKNLSTKIGEDNVSELDQLSELSKRSVFKWDRFSLIEIIEKYKQLKNTVK